MSYLCGMYFTSVTRYSPEHGRTLPYYKIKESFRDVLGRVHTRVMLTPGYLPDVCCDEIVQIRRGLTYLMEQSALIPGQPTLFPIDPRSEYSEKVCTYIDKFWTEIKSSGKIDAARDSYDKAERKARRLIDVNTVQHTDAREVGAENVCLQAIRELQIDQFLRREGWSERRIDATLASLIVRTVYAPSEWKSLHHPLLDRDKPHPLHAEGHHHRGRQCHWRTGGNAALLRPHRPRSRTIPPLRYNSTPFKRYRIQPSNPPPEKNL